MSPLNKIKNCVWSMYTSKFYFFFKGVQAKGRWALKKKKEVQEKTPPPQIKKKKKRKEKIAKLNKKEDIFL